MASSRCPTCTTCTPRGGIDGAGSKAPAQILGPRRRTRAWLQTAFGMFAASFPGFVIGYFTGTDGRVSAPLLGALAACAYSWFAAPAVLGRTPVRPLSAV